MSICQDQRQLTLLAVGLLVSLYLLSPAEYESNSNNDATDIISQCDSYRLVLLF